MWRSSDAKFFLSNDSGEDIENESGDEEGSRAIAGLGELDIADQAIFDGRRYLGLSAPQTLSLTPRELAIEMRAYTESFYDSYEKKAQQAMMVRAAYHAKKLKATDLFRRPVDEAAAKSRAEEMRERSDYAMRWISQFEEFQGKEGVINGEWYSH